MSRQWTIPEVFDAVADAVPERTMTICGQNRRTFAEAHDRTTRLASFLMRRGLGAHRERESLEDWECGQDRVALIMHNDLYVDAVISCLRARTIPVNINHNYSEAEIADLLAYVEPTAIIFHRGLGARFAEAIEKLNIPTLISAEDESGAPLLKGSLSLDEAVASAPNDELPAGSPDDLVMMCTGGTTGRPKGVLWRQADMYVSSMSGADHVSVDEIIVRVARVADPWFALSPLMHAAGMWTAFNAILVGLPVVLYDSRSGFNAREALQIAEREKVSMVTMVGDAYAAPLVDELRRRSYDLSRLSGIGIGGAATNVRHQEALLAHLPKVTLANGYGSSETGNVGFGVSQSGSRTDDFDLRTGATLLSADFNRILSPGDDEIGWVARSGRIPLGYFKDPDATRATFRRVGDWRVVIAGDRAKLTADGKLTLLGRDSLVVNTGGEKVFVEEVEEVIRAHPDVADALVVGVPSDRWGQELAAVVSLHRALSEIESLRDHCRLGLARFKVPKQFILVDAIRRLGNGKADYRWAREVATKHSERIP